MRFTETAVSGAFIVELDEIGDARGSFMRTFCRDAFAEAGIEMEVVQANLSRNRARHTLRGMHYQASPHGEPKLVQCVRGSIYDVAVDLRPNSPTCGTWAALTLDADSSRCFYIPAGCAHGFLTLANDSDVFYYMGARYVPGSARGVRWDDPAFAIAWPAAPEVISERDAAYPDHLRSGAEA